MMRSAGGVVEVDDEVSWGCGGWVSWVWWK